MTAHKPNTLTVKVVREAERYLSLSSKVMAQLVTTHGTCQLAKRKFRPFHTLTTAIISQQLSAKASDTIERRIKEVVPTFCPSEFLAVPFELLRKAGLSTAKVRYIKELATRVNGGRLNFDTLRQQPDDNVIATLTELPGIGRWTAEMFLIFGLKRPDVLSIGDAGLQRATRLLYGDNAELKSVGQAWKPYRSVASWYLWRHLD